VIDKGAVGRPSWCGIRTLTQPRHAPGFISRADLWRTVPRPDLLLDAHGVWCDSTCRAVAFRSVHRGALTRSDFAPTPPLVHVNNRPPGDFVDRTPAITDVNKPHISYLLESQSSFNKVSPASPGCGATRSPDGFIAAAVIDGAVWLAGGVPFSFR
jgi:hypothetical protein